MRQTEYLLGVLSYYRENDIQQGDPNEGKWEEAHTPLPIGKGDKTVLLLHQHHVIHDVWQSLELGECHFYLADVRKVLRLSQYWQSDWLELCEVSEHYGREQRRRNGLNADLHLPSRLAGLEKARTPEHQSKAGKRGAAVMHSQRWQSTIDPSIISTAAGVAAAHRARGWDTKARVHLSP